MKKIWVAGSLNTDLTIQCPNFPNVGQTISGSGFMVGQGGKGANQAVAASKMGGLVQMCGAVGKDLFGANLMEGLACANVDVKQIRQRDEIPTGTAIIILSAGDNRIILDAGANATLSHEDLDLFLADAAPGDIFMTQLENPTDVVGYGLCRAHQKGMTTILNPAPANKQIIPYLKYVDILIPNEGELELLGGKAALFQNGVRQIITTLGKNGHEIADNNTSKHYSCMKVDVVDTTAAGDTFCGAFAAELSRGGSVEESSLFASRAASIACTRLGAQQSIPMRNEVNAMLEGAF